MRLERNRSCDVLVLGSGIAGIMAALTAAKEGRNVLLAAGPALFSGSSFYPGTWGLGLIGPESMEDAQDLIATIQDVGCGMADPELVGTFVQGINPSIQLLQDMGVQLKKPDANGQREFIPCFDHKQRNWNGLLADSMRAVFSKAISDLGIQVLEQAEALELAVVEGRVCGAVVAVRNAIEYISSRAVILATGGYGGLFRHHLCTADIAGMGQALALQAGAKLTNLEFMQMMPGYLDPAYKTVFNEKSFRYTEWKNAQGEPVLSQEQLPLLELRSAYGPFTCRLASNVIDMKLYEVSMSNSSGAVITYRDEMKHNPPEFLQIYFDWLKKAKGLTMDDPVRVGIFAHAANGGVCINKDGFTGIAGLYACGEVTGGMHGADRIGGLSTANGLVFGIRAGMAASADRLPMRHVNTYEFDMWETNAPNELHSELQSIMTQSAMVIRTEDALSKALHWVAAQRAQLGRKPSLDVRQITASRRIAGQLATAQCILTSARLRRESRGSHYRSDYPYQSARYDGRIEMEGFHTPRPIHAKSCAKETISRIIDP